MIEKRADFILIKCCLSIFFNHTDYNLNKKKVVKQTFST